MNFGLYKCESYEYVCSSKLQNIIMNTVRMTDVKHYQGKKGHIDSFRFTIGPHIMYWNHMFIWESQKHKEGGGEKSAKANYANKIIQLSCNPSLPATNEKKY